ncbi:MAG TPA: carboxypeptidase regulatory-like domain-containing protein [Longimicrobiales bacterium]|nr:carboxypeptidase regulatory-like domain-containing protein [Longimicrobiales bacterium]
MRVRAVVRSLLAISAAWAFGAPEVVAQAAAARTGSIRGEVFDSIARAPLVDAAVFLWGTTHRSATDEDGRFEIADVPPGDYTLLFFHTRLGEMGVSPGPTSVRIEAGKTLDVRLGTPSWFTSVVSECLFGERAPGTGALAGWVGDGETGMGMPGAQVSLSWNVQGAKEPRRMTLEADAAGWYRTCDAPADVPITAYARFLDRQGLRREVTVAEGDVAEAGFLLWEMAPSKVDGKVVDAVTGAPVGEAEVWLRGTSFRGLTGPQGTFRFGSVPPGSYMLFVRHLGYGLKQDTLRVPSGETLSVEMRVDTEAFEIDPITVTVQSSSVGDRAMGGLTIDREAIDRVRGRVRDAADILQSQNLPGVIVRRRGDGSLCVGSAPGQVRMMFNPGCVPMVVFINNVRATNTELALQLPPESIDRIVIYRPVDAGTIFGLGSGNGVIQIYTRRR